MESLNKADIEFILPNRGERVHTINTKHFTQKLTANFTHTLKKIHQDKSRIFLDLNKTSEVRKVYRVISQ